MRCMRFADRGKAGRLLADKLRSYAGNAVVYALPREGVVLGVEVAQSLPVPLDLLSVRKTGPPAKIVLAMPILPEVLA